MAAVPLTRLLELDASIFARFGVGVGVGVGTEDQDTGDPQARRLGWPELERILPDRGLPRGVVEIASPVALVGGQARALRGGATSIALSAIRTAQASSPGVWCAWITPAQGPSLYAPAIAQAGVDLDRLLVVRPETSALARTAVKVGASGAFAIVVIDAQSGLDGRISNRALLGMPQEIPLPRPARGAGSAGGARTKRPVDGSLVVRKLALASEEHGTTFVLLASTLAERAMPWPVALRLEVERRTESIAVRVTKDRRGRVTHGDLRAPAHVVRLPGTT